MLIQHVSSVVNDSWFAMVRRGQGGSVTPFPSQSADWLLSCAYMEWMPCTALLLRCLGWMFQQRLTCCSEMFVLAYHAMPPLSYSFDKGPYEGWNP